MDFLFRYNIENTNSFLFSNYHLLLLALVVVFLYFTPNLTKNLLPYSYLIEKIICILFLSELIFEQLFFILTKQYNPMINLPLSISRITTFICIYILFFKKYHLFNVFFSWGIVSCISELIFFPNMQFRFPHITYFSYIFYHCLILYTIIYLIEVRKFKINEYAIKDNLFASFVYFSCIITLNIICGTHYGFLFNINKLVPSLIYIISFIIVTTIIYIPWFIIKKKSKV